MEVISATEANRKFSQILREVKDGGSYIVTSHGNNVAKISPVGRNNEVLSNAKSMLLSRLERQPIIRAEAWSRDTLYEDAS